MHQARTAALRRSRASEETRPQSTLFTRRHRPDMQILLYMGLLMMLGLVVMFAIGPQRANGLNAAMGEDYYSDTYFFVRQLISIGVALIGFAAMALIPFERIFALRRVALLAGIGACLLLAFAAMIGWGIALDTGGAVRWFDFGAISLQPAEILKFGILVHLAVFLGVQARKGKIDDWQETLLPAGIIIAVAGVLVIVIQKDLGTGISVLSIVVSMLMAAGLSWRKFGMIMAAIGVAGVLLVVSAPHRVDRMMTFLQGDQTSTSNASTYHIEHAKIAIGTGGLLGVGIGNSVQATGYLPEAINDSVFAIMGETFGFVGLVATIALFVALLMRLLKVMDHLADYRLKLVAAGVFGWFGVHVILNIGAMIGLVPLTGITLPLLSFGGTSMLFVAAALGLVFQLSRYTTHGSVIKEADYESSSNRRRVGGPRYASRRSS